MAAAEGVAKFRLWVDASAKPTKVFVLHSIIVLPKAQDLSPCRLLDIGSMNVTICRVVCYTKEMGGERGGGGGGGGGGGEGRA